MAYSSLGPWLFVVVVACCLLLLAFVAYTGIDEFSVLSLVLLLDCRAIEMGDVIFYMTKSWYRWGLLLLVNSRTVYANLLFIYFIYSV